MTADGLQFYLLWLTTVQRFFKNLANFSMTCKMNVSDHFNVVNVFINKTCL